MTAQLLESPVSFDDFIEWLPETSECRYELHRGRIVEMPKPKGKHSQVAGYIALKAGIEIERLSHPWFVPKECIVQSIAGDSAYEPDVIVLDEPALAEEPRWESGSIITLGKSIKLIVEVVSTNWRDDYLTKLGEYEALGIPEYWIVDYAAFGGRLHIGNPKQPTLSVYSLVEGEYEVQRFQSGEYLHSPTFSGLNLFVEKIFEAGKEPE
ncbi:MAG: Uma2 family endonuclease [Oculatellaceae cyanobacterium Prado106]|jgi:Uma2 family endonuclease|nr:Uma2 family endonuclease [Oculatellaceae cyanobacterium Prado106]